ncbi:MAG: hypothetical protein JNL02_06045, partial [Saprospiraceae bacterium]|nr:hypothetical protein [Saprospiraceae bacterium]
MKKAFTLLLLLTSLGISPVFGQEWFELRNPDVVQGEFLGETMPLRDYVADPNRPSEVTRKEKLGYSPKKDWPLHDKVNPNALPLGMDPALQTTYSVPADSGSAQKMMTQRYSGIAYTFVNPSDANADVSPNHVIQMINHSSGSLFAVWNKAGGLISGPNEFDAFFSFPDGLGDPIVMYDQLADRWFLSEFSTGNKLHIAVSTTSDPLGTYYKYSFTAPQFPDYPKYSVWPNAYYMTSNESDPAVYAFDRAKMLAGLPATYIRFTMPSFPTIGFQAATPVAVEGPTAPPANSPGIIMRMADDGWSPGIPFDRLEIYEFTPDFVTPANSTLTGPTNLATQPFDTELCGYLAFACVDQPGSSIKLDPLREVLMYQVQYRNFGTHESIVTNHVTDVSGNDDTGIRWYELRRSGGGPWSIYQQGTYSPDGTSRWMGAIAINGNGDIGLMYNVSSNSVYPGIRYTGRKACDPLGQMTTPETVVVNGAAANGSNRYGDYNSLSVDPSNETTFWGTAQYNPTSQWATEITSFTLTGDCCPTIGSLSSSPTAACPSANVTLTASGLANMSTTYGITFKYFSAPTADPYTGGTVIATLPNSNLGGGGTTATTNTSFSSTGTYYIYAVLWPTPSDVNCRPSATLTFEVVPPPVVSINVTETSGTTPNDGIICNGASVQLSANATGAFDQQQTSDPNCMANFFQADLAQSFKPATSVLCGAGIKLRDNYASTATIRLYTNLPNAGGVLLAEGTASVPGAGWLDVSWPSVTVTPGATYYLVFSGSPNLQCINGNTNNPYPDGQTYANGGFQSFPSFDYTFRTYSCPPSPGYLWSTTETTPAITVSPGSNTTYTVTVTNQGCSSSASRSIVVNPTPNAVATPASQTICSG